MKELTCIVCPRGCTLTVFPERGEVTGNGCSRGVEYGLKEVTAPVRTLTTTVSIRDAIHPRLPVKTSKPIPKERIMALMEAVSHLQVQAPVALGDVIVSNILDTGADLVACRSM